MATAQSIIAAIESNAFADLVRESTWLFPFLETIHVIAMALVFGSIAMVDVRLLNIGWRDRSVNEFLSSVLPWTVTAFLVAAISGTALFTSNSAAYLGNTPFQVKGVLLALIGVNILAVHAGPLRQAAGWPVNYVPLSAKVSGAVSLSAWTAVVVLGRWIGFTV